MIRSRGIGLLLVAIIVFVLSGVTRVGWLLLFDAVLWGTLVLSAVMPWLATGSVKGGEISYHVGGVKLYHSSRLDPRCYCS